MRFTFKKEPRLTGLAAIGSRQVTNVKLGGYEVGAIVPAHYRDPDQRFKIRLAIVQEPTPSDPCSFRWIALKARFETEAEARTWLNTFAAELQTKFHLHRFAHE